MAGAKPARGALPAIIISVRRDELVLATLRTVTVVITGRLSTANVGNISRQHAISGNTRHRAPRDLEHVEYKARRGDRRAERRHGGW